VTVHQRVEGEAAVIEALEDLDGEGRTSEIAAVGELPSISTLVTLGKLREKKVEEVTERSHKGDPCWRLIGYKPPSTEIRDRWATTRPRPGRSGA
jgi:hypothetical protein